MELIPYKPGYAYLYLKGIPQNETQVQFTLKRNQDNKFLAESDGWSSEPVLHKLSNLEREGEFCKSLLGPELVDQLAIQTRNMMYFLTVQTAGNGIEQKGPLRIKGNLLSSAAAATTEFSSLGRNQKPIEHVANLTDDNIQLDIEVTAEDSIDTANPELTENTVDIVENIPIQDSQIDTTSNVDQPPVKKSKLTKIILILGGIILLLLVAWYILKIILGMLGGKGGEPENSSNIKAECQLTKGIDEYDYINQCLSANPTDEELLNIIIKLKEDKQCDVVKRLYTSLSKQGNTTLGLAYAKEYDEKLYQTNTCFQAHKENAKYWYEQVKNTSKQDDASISNKQEAEKLLNELSK